MNTCSLSSLREAFCGPPGRNLPWSLQLEEPLPSNFHGCCFLAFLSQRGAVGGPLLTWPFHILDILTLEVKGFFTDTAILVCSVTGSTLSRIGFVTLGQ